MKNTVVIVDDTQLYREVLKNGIEKLGFDVLLCGDGGEAITCLEKHNASVVAVFLDIYMPQIDGISTLGHFRSNYPDMPVFMMTGSDDGVDRKSAEGLGAAGFFNKPFDPDTLDDMLAAALGIGASKKQAIG